jgi:hypothetical protein
VERWTGVGGEIKLGRQLRAGSARNATARGRQAAAPVLIERERRAV